jgi:hypothetical protein
VGALVLIVIGVVFLLQTMGVIPWTLWGELLRFWPVILIVIGLNILLGRRAPVLAGLLIALVLLLSLGGAYAIAVSEDAGRFGATTTMDLSEPLDGITSAEVQIDFGAGELTVRSLSEGSLSFVEGQLVTPRRAPDVTVLRADGEAELRMAMDEDSWLFSLPGFRGSGTDWEIALSRAPRLSIDVGAGAADIVLNLRDLQVQELNFDTGASNAEVTLPANAGHVDVVVNGGATNIEITVPEGVAARITNSSGLSSVDVDTDRFPRSGDAFVSPDFDTAQNRVAIDISVGAASVEVH